MAHPNVLIEGYKRFYKKHFVDDNRLYKELSTRGQSPKTLVIACSDSRVDPSIITDADPGDIFVVRNVANIVPPFQPEWGSYHGTSAALEFAIDGIGVESIVILGHSGCSGIRTLVDRNSENRKPNSFIDSWISIVEDALNGSSSASGCKYESCEQEAIRLSLRNLMTFPWIKEKVMANKLSLQGWYFSVNNGALSVCEPNQDNFKAVIV